MKSASTEQLITLIQATQNIAAFNELFERYQTKLSAFLYGAGAHADVIEDVMQETYLKVFRKINQFNHQASYSTWLFRVAYNELMMHFRKVSRFDQFKRHFASHIPDKDCHYDSELLLHIDQLSKLDDQVRRVVICHLLLGYSHAETAKILAIPLGTVKTNIKQGRQILNRH